MKKKVSFVAFSDFHLHNWGSHSKERSRLYWNEEILKTISEAALEHECPVLFCGDFFESPKTIENLTITLGLKWFNRYFEQRKIDFYAISGNHDQSEQNNFNHPSPSYLHGFMVFKHFYLMDWKTRRANGFTLRGIPYITGNVDFKSFVEPCDILMVHTDLHGAKKPEGGLVDTVENIDPYFNLFKDNKLVISGHIHKPQYITHNIMMLGATHQQRASDSGCEMGYWLIYEDLSMMHIPLDFMPKFIYIEDGQEIPTDTNFYVKIPKELEQEETESYGFKSNAQPKELAKRYLKAKNIKSKAKFKLLTKYLSI